MEVVFLWQMIVVGLFLGWGRELMVLIRGRVLLIGKGIVLIRGRALLIGKGILLIRERDLLIEDRILLG